MNAGASAKRGGQPSLSEPEVQIKEESAPLVPAAVMEAPAQPSTRRDSRGRGKRASKKS